MNMTTNLEPKQEMEEDRPAKRIKLDQPLATATATSNSDLDKETRVGITAYVSPETQGFSGVLKQRYTDFQVNEITLDGKVVRFVDKEAIGLEVDDVEKETPEAVDTISMQDEQESKDLEEKTHDNGVQSEHKGKVQKKAAVEKPKPPPVNEEDLQAIQDVFGADISTDIVKLNNLVFAHPNWRPREFQSVLSDSIADKSHRTKAHLLIKKLSAGFLETKTGDENRIEIKAATVSQRGPKKSTKPNPNQNSERRGKIGWEDLGGEWLHFTLYKENKDTMEVVSYIGSVIKMHHRNFQFAGTKDKRGVTVQRICAKRLDVDRMRKLNKTLRNSYIGDFKYEQRQLSLGDLSGNEFHIALRDCHIEGGTDANERLTHAQNIVRKAVTAFAEKGFINYYGLQRFGSFSASTDAIGKAMLQGDLKSAAELICQYSPDTLAAAHNSDSTNFISREDKERAEAIHIWQTTGNGQKAQNKLPRKFGAELALIRHLSSKNGKGDFQGAFMAMPRNLRLIYVHAYQSLVWNTVASKRIQVYGANVVEGDLVLINDHQNKTNLRKDVDEVDQAGEIVVAPLEEDRAMKNEDFERARPLTKEEADSGEYGIFDIVLPLPGYDVEYPRNEIGRFYEEFMASKDGGELDPHNMRRKWKDISLSGSYRKLLAKPGPNITGEVRQYWSDEEQLLETDVDRLRRANGLSEPQAHQKRAQPAVTAQNGSPTKLAVILKFQLGSSTYATMALRELMKAGGLVQFKPEYSGRT
jgi:tRNA pseudouridine13 synthase